MTGTGPERAAARVAQAQVRAAEQQLQAARARVMASFEANSDLT